MYHILRGKPKLDQLCHDDLINGCLRMLRNVIMLFPKITNGPRAHGDPDAHRIMRWSRRDNVIVRFVYSCCSTFLTMYILGHR